MFQKGQSGNPKGRPKEEDSAAAMIRSVVTKQDWKKAARSLLQVLYIEHEDDLTGEKVWMPNPDTNGREKAAAYNALADRAFGKALQKQVVKNISAPPVDDEAVKSLREAILGGE